MTRFLVICFLAFALAPLGLRAQTDQTGVLRGRVLDQNGIAIANAQVSIALADGSYPGQAMTDENGLYRIGFLKPGLYTVTVRTIGYRPVVHTGVRIRATETTTLDIVSQSAPVQLEPVTVQAEEALVEGDGHVRAAE